MARHLTSMSIFMRRRSPAVLASPFFPLSSARSSSPYGLIASESESYRILHLFLMHVNAIRFDVSSSRAVDPEERTDAVSTRTGSLRSDASRGVGVRDFPGGELPAQLPTSSRRRRSAAPRRAWPFDFTRTTKPSSRAREPRRKKTGCANGSPPDRARLSTWRSRERTARDKCHPLRSQPLHPGVTASRGLRM
jgi:hypothetical protein